MPDGKLFKDFLFAPLLCLLRIIKEEKQAEKEEQRQEEKAQRQEDQYHCPPAQPDTDGSPQCIPDPPGGKPQRRKRHHFFLLCQINGQCNAIHGHKAKEQIVNPPQHQVDDVFPCHGKHHKGNDQRGHRADRSVFFVLHIHISGDHKTDGIKDSGEFYACPAADISGGEAESHILDKTDQAQHQQRKHPERQRFRILRKEVHPLHLFPRAFRIPAFSSLHGSALCRFTGPICTAPAQKHPNAPQCFPRLRAKQQDGNVYGKHCQQEIDKRNGTVFKKASFPGQ